MPLPEGKPVILVLLKKTPCKVITVTKVGIHPTLSSHLSQTSISSIYMLILSTGNFLFLYFVNNKEVFREKRLDYINVSQLIMKFKDKK